MRHSGWGALSILALSLGCSSGDQGVKPAGWPNLSTLNNYPNPHGNTCSEDGTTSSGREPRGEKREENQQKNRYLLPSKYKTYTVDQVLALPPTARQTLVNSGATVIGYISAVLPGGSGESCNCNATRTELLDAHIEVVSDPSRQSPDGKGILIVEVTERSRRLALSGLLKTNIGNDWSTRQLKRGLEGHWVKLSGWLFYDPDHVEESWSNDSKDTIGNPNWRGSSWELHPIMGIEVLTGKPSS